MVTCSSCRSPRPRPGCCASFWCPMRQRSTLPDRTHKRTKDMTSPAKDSELDGNATAVRARRASTSEDLSPPLRGVRIVEFEGIGPGPLAARMLAGMGAEVTTIVRPGPSVVTERLAGEGDNPLRKGKRIEPIDVKSPTGLARAMELIAAADALIEGNRPGVMERLGLGPADCAARNPRLVYGRMTGWGQHGPLAQAAGHDLNYVALSGLLSLSARKGEAPIVPPTVVGDASGALGLAFGIACALLDARKSGR